MTPVLESDVSEVQATDVQTGDLIQIAEGAVQGVSVNGVRRFLGMPYAAPPVGANRWRRPQPVTSWEGVLDATQIGEVCPQIPIFGDGSIQGSEDCLTLNVFTPDGFIDTPSDGEEVHQLVTHNSFFVNEEETSVSDQVAVR